jgi:hypothetical protein
MAQEQQKFVAGLVPVLVAALLFLSGCPQEPKTSVALLDKCREVVNEQVKERRKDLEGEVTVLSQSSDGDEQIYHFV